YQLPSAVNKAIAAASAPAEIPLAPGTNPAYWHRFYNAGTSAAEIVGVSQAQPYTEKTGTRRPAGGPGERLPVHGPERELRAAVRDRRPGLQLSAHLRWRARDGGRDRRPLLVLLLLRHLLAAQLRLPCRLRGRPSAQRPLPDRRLRCRPQAGRPLRGDLAAVRADERVASDLPEPARRVAAVDPGRGPGRR